MKKLHALVFPLLISMALAASGAESTLCEANEQVIWSCHASKKTYSVCASPNLSGTTGYMQYRVGTPAKLEFAYPANREHPKGRFNLNMGPHGASLDFKNSGFNYSVAEDARGLPLIFVDKNDRQIAKVQCKDATGDLLGNSTIDLMRKAGVLIDN